MSGGLAGRCAVITGGAGDIGRAMAAELSRSGARVALADVNRNGADRAAASLDSSNQDVIGVPCDVRDRDSIKRAFSEVEQRLGPIDVLVNNAGLQIMRSFWELEEAEWDEVLAVNLKGTMLCCQVAGAAMKERGYGRIINHSSLAGQQGGLVMGAHYASSKAGIGVLTKILAGDLAPHGVTVNAIAPAAIAGKLLDALGAERVEHMQQRIPVGRTGRPEEVAAVVAFLASNQAGYITGATVDLNGGVAMR